MQIETWPIDKPTPYEKNPRVIPDHAIDKVAMSLREYGWNQPIVVDKDGVIIAGHTRLKAAKKLGLKKVPVLVADLTEEKARAYRIADNRTNQEAEWDDGILLEEMDFLKDLGFDLALTGFDPDEIADLFAEETEGLTDPDEVPEPPANPTTVQGDVWVLGNHRLFCGDSTDWGVVDTILGGAQADMVFTDPPYGVAFQSGMSKGGTATRFDKLANDDKILEIEPNVTAALRNDGAMFVWTSHQVYPQWREQFSKHYKHTIIWHKPGGGIGDLKGNYATDYELCLFGVKGSVRFRGKRGMAVWTISKDGATEYKHPTQKPVELAARAIVDFTDHGYTVLDLFGGSGSTLIACEMKGRSCRMVELAPAYCDVIVKRWQDFTGKDAVLDGDGRTFAEITAEREGDVSLAIPDDPESKPKKKAKANG